MRKNSFWLLEILIGFILLVGLISIGITFTENYLSSRKTYNVTFKDVDGLIVGSPVRVMGIQVGHVIKVKPVNDNVNVIFVITNNNVNISKNSVINVQFTGIAGSKSLEIQPSISHKSGEELFKVTEPIRIDSVMNSQLDITKSILECSKLSLNFLGHQTEKEFRKTIKESEIVTRNINYSLNNAYSKLKTSNNEMISDSRNIQKFLIDETQDMDYINNEVFGFPLTNKQRVISLLNDVQNVNRSFEKGGIDNYADRFVNNLKTANGNISGLNQNLKKAGSKNSGFIDAVYNSINGFSNGCEKVSVFIEKSFKRDNIQKIHTKTEMLKNKTRYE